MLRAFTAAVVLTVCALLSVDPSAFAAPTSAQSASGKRVYLVRMRDLPVAAYTGNIQGYPATMPARGKRLDKRNPNVARYAQYLRDKHDAALKSVGGARKIYSYAFALNGFAAELTEAQAAKLRAHPGVVAVVENEILKLDTITTPKFLGLDGPHGLWKQLGGDKRAGDDIIVGVIDSGIIPEHPSFQPVPGVHKGIPAGWAGVCEAGEQFPANSCNNKLLGARFFIDGFGEQTVRQLFPYEYISPRAADGHGVHTASTAAGNQVKAVESDTKLGVISGMAPGARLAIYKACWGFGEDPAAGCSTIDTSAAIDTAVADGVDVINFSISGSLTSFVNSVEVAFLFAAEAGVFVAASAGNDGPAASTVAHNSPWVTTVAAGTHDRRYVGAKVVLGNHAEYQGVSLNDKNTGNKEMILAADAARPGADPAEAALCFPGTLDPKKVKGKIVVCDRGVSARVEKSAVVDEAGGAGMVLVNVVEGTLNADIHAVPTVHVDHIVGPKIKAYVASTKKPSARLTKAEVDLGNVAPNVAGFSSRGPALAGGGDILKPDILAPGVDILAAYSPLQFGHDYEFLLGTSMSSPHIAGIAALVKQKHPDWSPMMIKSALMTTATPLRNDFRPIKQLQEDEMTTEPGSPLAYGAGLVRPDEAVDPGLVYDAGFNDWIAFLCGTGQLACAPEESIDPSDLNYPSIAIGALTGTQTVTRTVTNVSRHPSIYVALVDKPKGIDVDVSPRYFVIGPGQSKTYTVTVTARSSARINEFAHGNIIWVDGRHTVRSPLAVRPVPLAAPAEVTSNGGPVSYEVEFGYTGPFQASPRGLIPAIETVSTVLDDPDDDVLTGNIGPGTSAVFFPVTIPAGTTYTRFALFDSETSGMGNDDLDLYLLSPAGVILAVSGNVSSNEEINLVNPAPGTFFILVHGFNTANGVSSTFTLFTWMLGTADAGNMTIAAPANATTNQTGTITLNFTGLNPGTKYLGSVVYSGADGMPPPTIVRADP